MHDRHLSRGLNSPLELLHFPPESAPVAQLDRAPGFEPVGCAFESRRARVSNSSRNEVSDGPKSCPASSTWQSNGFLIRGLQVQFLRGVSQTSPAATGVVKLG